MIIVAFGAHPTDIFVDFGGALVKNARRGDIVYPIACTYGVDIHTEKVGSLGVEKIRQIRQEEMIAASKMAGFAEPRILGWDPEPTVIPQQVDWDLRLFYDVRISEVSQIIRELKPDIVVTHNPEDENEHGVVSKAVTRSCEVAGKDCVKTSSPPHSIGTLCWSYDNCGLFCNRVKVEFETFGDTYLFDYDVVDITDSIDVKIKSSLVFDSRSLDADQFGNAIRAEANRFGAFLDIEYAEIFKRMHRPIMAHLG